MTDIGLKRYRLLFLGQTLPDADVDAAKQALAKRYRLDDNKLALCFSGKRIVLHRDLDEHSAYRLQAELKRLGLATRLEPVTPAPPAAEAGMAPSPATPPPPNPTPAPPTQAMIRCPSCQRQIRANALRCQFCGRDMRPASVSTRIKRLIRPALFLAALVAVGFTLAPTYHGYKVQQRVDRGLDQTRRVQAVLTQFISRTGFLPNSNQDASLSTPESFATDVVASLRVSHRGQLTLTFQPDLSEIGGQTLVFAASKTADGKVSWSCVGGSLATRWRPASCPPGPESP